MCVARCGQGRCLGAAWALRMGRGVPWRAPPPPPPEGYQAIARVHKRQSAQSAEGKTKGTVLSQRMRHEDASGQATDK